MRVKELEALVHIVVVALACPLLIPFVEGVKNEDMGDVHQPAAMERVSAESSADERQSPDAGDLGDILPAD